MSEVLFLVFVKFWNYAFTWKPYQQIVVKDLTCSCTMVYSRYLVNKKPIDVVVSSLRKTRNNVNPVAISDDVDWCPLGC